MELKIEKHEQVQVNRRGQGKWPRQTTNLVRGWGKSTSYHYIKLT